MGKLLGLKIAGGLFLAYIVAGFLGVPYVITHIVPKKVSEATQGGRLHIESAAFNPFLFELDLHNLSFKTPANGDFVAFNQFSINLDPLDYLWKQTLVVEDIHVEGPRVSVAKDHAGQMNFGWLIKEDNTTKEESKPLSLLVKNFTLKGGVVKYSDISKGKNYHESIDNFGFHLENIDLRDMSVSHGATRLYATINDGGFIDLKGKMDSLKPFAMHGNVVFASGKLSTPWRYVKDKMPIEVVDGTMNLSFDYSLNTNDLNGTKLSNVSAGVKKLRILSKEKEEKLFSLDSLAVSGANVWPLRKYLEAQDVRLEGIDLSALRAKDGSINWVRYADEIKKAFPDDENDTDKTPWSYLLSSLSLERGAVRFVDEVPSHSVTVNLDALNLSILNFTSNPHDKNNFSLSTRINEKSSLTLQGDIIREALISTGHFTLSGLDVSAFDSYIEPSTYATIKRGVFGISGEYSYNKDKTTVRGKLDLTDWVINDSRDQSVLAGWQNIGVTPFVYAYPDNRLKINQLDVNGLYANALIDANKTLNFSTLSKISKESNTPKQQTKNPFGVDIIKFVVNNGSATFSDLSLPLLFKTYIHYLNGEILGISTTKDVVTYVKLSGGVDQYGMAHVSGKLNTKAPKDFTDIIVNFDNLDIKQYTPYSLEFLGYKIVGGKLYLNLGYVINKGKLNGKNKVLIKQIELGEEKAGGSPWPLGLVVALLEDSEGVIDIDLPIEGDVNSPDFKYGKVVWQVIGNLFTKAVTSPFKLMGSLMGLDSEDDSLSSVNFEAGEAILLPPEREKLDKLTALMQKRPKLLLKIHGGWESMEDDRALRIQKLIASVMGNKGARTSREAMSMEYLEATAEKTLDPSELKALRMAMKTQYTEEGAYVKHYSAALLEKLIVHQVIAPPELDALATARAQTVVNYLMQNPALSGRASVVSNEKSAADANKLIASRLELTVQ
ncbi:MAG: DUF748 domain-containing protein [Sulfuricurvum sp.]|uniref:DUF748 domain-containing protein n=1 Tax=Sulfuricurvum sp. TaxID=2025608 RepID=UPI0026155150|nr:DUF748 domain-containing protein [Sulfuricurvum sp.]MDD2828408.1 DUF748 domain-containing protein [Sulfuricurvum sp.]MDD4949413.1 DUF748 domain-containing protein [Sulfuricurvum sp.]